MSLRHGLYRGRAGPFNTKTEMEDWFNHKLNACQQLKQASLSVLPFKFSRSVLTHNDIAARKLILDTGGKVWLVDWGQTGILPLRMDAATLVADHFRAPAFTDMLLGKIERHEVFVRQLQSIMYGLTNGSLM